MAIFSFPELPLPEVVQGIWRRSLDRLGYAFSPLPANTSSLMLRRYLQELVRHFSVILDTPFVPERLGRFDQQVTTKFHRDGAPEESLLILGYEPSTVPSRFFIADACQASKVANLGVNAFLAANNPMFPPGEAKLQPYVRELPFDVTTGAIVIVNNSLYPDDAESPVLGLLHKGEIVKPDPNAQRVINSMGLTPDGPNVRKLDRTAVEYFLTRTDLD